MTPATKADGRLDMASHWASTLVAARTVIDYWRGGETGWELELAGRKVFDALHQALDDAEGALAGLGGGPLNDEARAQLRSSVEHLSLVTYLLGETRPDEEVGPLHPAYNSDQYRGELVDSLYGVYDIAKLTRDRIREALEDESSGDDPFLTSDDRPGDLNHGLAWEAITVLALAERLAMDFGHRFVGKRMLHELAEVRHRIEDHIGVDGKLSDGIVGHASDRYDAIKREAREEVAP